MEEENTYEINSNSDGGLKEKPPRKEFFQERRESIVEREIEDITTQIASNMRVNLDPEIANSAVKKSSYENPLSLDILGQYFGNVEVNPKEKAPIWIYPYGEFDYENISVQELNDDFTPERLVSTLLWSSAMLKLPVETYKSPMDLQNFKITPRTKEEILEYMVKKGNKEVSDTIKVISKKPPENITDEDIEYLIEARRKRGGLTKDGVDKEASRLREQIKPLLLEDKWGNLPPEVLSHVLSIDARKETIELGDLVSEVYPAFDKYKEDINEALKLAFLDREKFIEKYVENYIVRGNFDRFLFDLENKTPHLSYKTAVALSSMALMVAACSPIVSSTPAGAVPGGGEIPEETIVLETEEETSPTPMLIETASPTPFPTPFPTQIPTETPKPLITEVPSAKPSYSFLEEYKKNGYAVSIDTIHSSEFGEQLVISFVLPIFTYQGYEVTADGDYMIGEVEIQGEKYVVKILIDPEISHYNTRGTSSYYFKDKEVADKWMKSFVNYVVFVVPMKTEEEDIFYRKNIFDTYSEEDWRTFRSEFRELLTQGGSTPEQEIMLYIVTPFDDYEKYVK